MVRVRGEFVRIAPDVRLAHDVGIHALVSLCGREIGDETSIGACVEGRKGAHSGACAKASSHTFVRRGATIKDEAFVGHGVVFANDRYPGARTAAGVPQGEADWACSPTLVGQGASIDSNATLHCGVTVGERAVVGVGSAVTHDVPVGAIVAGVPARMARRIAHKPMRFGVPAGLEPGGPGGEP